jgi:hypothetical protein
MRRTALLLVLAVSGCMPGLISLQRLPRSERRAFLACYDHVAAVSCPRTTTNTPVDQCMDDLAAKYSGLSDVDARKAFLFRRACHEQIVGAHLPAKAAAPTTVTPLPAAPATATK